MDLQASGPFTLERSFDPPFHEQDGVVLGRARFEKTFEGELSATSTVDMLYARTADPSTASYVALERIDGTLCGLRGSFVVTHVAARDPDGASLVLTIVPGTGTGALDGLTGSMTIDIEGDGGHRYRLSATLPDLV